MATFRDPDTTNSEVNENNVLVVNTDSSKEDQPLGSDHPEVTTESIGNILLQAVNAGIINPEKLSDTIANSHRYLQNQIYVSIIKPVIKKLADNRTDTRNEKAVTECQEIVETVFDDK